VEQISLMKPKAEDKNDTGLLEYLEDIIGTDQYKDAIEDAAKELEELNEKRQTFVHRAKLAGVQCVAAEAHISFLQLLHFTWRSLFARTA
jgi:hypothetical protein